MSCSVSNLAAYRSGCKNVGGVKRFWYWLKSARLSTDVVISQAAGVATITGVGPVVSAYEVIPEQDNWNLTQPITDANAQGTSFVTQTLQGNLFGISAALSALMDDLRKARFEALVELENGELLFLGLSDRGLQSNGGDAGFSGTAIGDGQGVNVILTSESKLGAPLLADIADFEGAFTIVQPPL